MELSFGYQLGRHFSTTPSASGLAFRTQHRPLLVQARTGWAGSYRLSSTCAGWAQPVQPVQPLQASQDRSMSILWKDKLFGDISILMSLEMGCHLTGESSCHLLGHLYIGNITCTRSVSFVHDNLYRLSSSTCTSLCLNLYNTRSVIWIRES